MVLHTPIKRKQFTVKSVETDRIVFSVGSGLTISVPKACWDGIPNFLRDKGWVEAKPRHQVAERGTLEEYLDRCLPKRHASWGSYVVPILERLGIVEVYRQRPFRVKLT